MNNKICENCNEETDKNLTSQFYELLKITKKVCHKCWEDEHNKINSRRIQKQNSDKKPPKKQLSFKAWVSHLHDKHNISEIKLQITFDNFFIEYQKQGHSTRDNKFREKCRLFCIKLDSKLHYLPFAMQNKCDRYNPQKNIRCTTCKMHRPNCYSFAPNNRFIEAQKQKYININYEHKKQKTIDNIFSEKIDVSDNRQKSRMNYKINIINTNEGD